MSFSRITLQELIQYNVSMDGNTDQDKRQRAQNIQEAFELGVQVSQETWNDLAPMTSSIFNFSVFKGRTFKMATNKDVMVKCRLLCNVSDFNDVLDFFVQQTGIPLSSFKPHTLSILGDIPFEKSAKDLPTDTLFLGHTHEGHQENFLRRKNDVVGLGKGRPQFYPVEKVAVLEVLGSIAS